ncbi:glycosyltransferase family 2 protein [Conexibacter sp. DBS9H8]|uniref:glycosyltransferase family 2 protein n=1 Tax=Conexibacter sp. DBS9H8 TaxID=2937801 RepID=UPI00200E4038|nr:glycosyltransferase family 2 protein [Conexibacter sp. DBS9H8]
MTAAIVICAHTMERWDVLCAAVHACRTQTHPPDELILVVDRNEELRARAEAELAVDAAIANQHPTGGASGGRMTGTELATASIIVFLDDDAVPEPSWLEALLEPFADPDVVGVGGEVIPMWTTPPPRFLAPEFYWVIGCTWAGMGVTNGRIRNPIAANMAVRRDLLVAAGGFPSELGRSGSGTAVSGTAEETEVAIRVAASRPGGFWAFSEGARVHHQVPPGRTTWRYFRDRCVLEGRAKAVVVKLAGPAGLSSETAYTTRVLPRAVLANLVAAFAGDGDGAPRAAGIVAGFLFTAVAYLGAAVRIRLGRQAFPARGG